MKLREQTLRELDNVLSQTKPTEDESVSRMFCIDDLGDSFLPAFAEQVRLLKLLEGRMIKSVEIVRIKPESPWLADLKITLYPQSWELRKGFFAAAT